MSKSFVTIFVTGGIAALFITILGATFVLGSGYFQIRDQVSLTVAPSLEAITASPTITPTPTSSATPTGEGTAAPTPNNTPQPSNAAQPTTIPLSSTTVEYVLALADVNIRSGPGTGFPSIGFVAGGQTARVTGLNTSSGWWRVICLDGSTGSCWVTGSTQYTKATTTPGGQPQPSPTTNSTISGLVYQDYNQNGIYDSGEPLMANREIWLVPGIACHVRQNAVSTTLSDNIGRYSLNGAFSGSFCLGLNGNGGLDDVVAIDLVAGQNLGGIDLKSAVPNQSITGFVWSDYCFYNDATGILEGSCVADGFGGYQAEGQIEPSETYISGVTVFLRLGSCASDETVAIQAITDYSGKYVFDSLTPGTFCIYIHANTAANAGPLGFGNWTFPSNGIWYQEITLRPGDSAYPVNFGWDFQSK